MADLSALVADIACGLVRNPDQVAVREVTNNHATVIELRVGEGDLGKVVGKQGRTARSLRAVLAAAALKANRRLTLEIVE